MQPGSPLRRVVVLRRTCLFALLGDFDPVTALLRGHGLKDFQSGRSVFEFERQLKIIIMGFGVEIGEQADAAQIELPRFATASRFHL